MDVQTVPEVIRTTLGFHHPPSETQEGSDLAGTDKAEQYAQYCNATWAPEFKAKEVGKGLPGPQPQAKIAIVTCMDARLGKGLS